MDRLLVDPRLALAAPAPASIPDASRGGACGRPARSLFPREHGASLELLSPLLPALALGARAGHRVVRRRRRGSGLGLAPRWLGLGPAPWSVAAIALETLPRSPKRVTVIDVSLLVAGALGLAVLVATPWGPP